MQDQVPNFSNEKIANIAKELYGLEGEIKALVSFEDQNARIKTANGRFVLKIANKRWSREFLQMQTDVLDHLKMVAPDMAFPEAVKTLKGETITYIDGFAVRLLTYLEGNILANMDRSPVLYKDIGRFLGQYSKAMESFPYDGTDGSDKYWKLDNVIACKKYLPEVDDLDARDRIERLYSHYEKNILPLLPDLRKAVIHSDANEQNFLINPERPEKIAGLIDFGEMQYASQVNELAITLAYSLLNEDDIDMASGNIIDGYIGEFPLEPLEQEILYDLMAMRLVTNITMTSHSAKMFPDNDYILISQKPARELLKKLEDENYILR
ncbi:MAG: phosphotransferase [Alphaproteobacteria bacterium]|nr:phosphotransferase [Alphaproteobacteria bacterium]HPF48004.1 phosphotransferase [Emcibacteraceae bacterium]HRW30217.1 phosphotransferase [Emcibacteraceae bacterium]